MNVFAINSPTYNPYDLLRVYTYYRTLLGAVLLLMFQGDIARNVLGNDNPDIFFYTSASYTLINFISLIMFWRVKFLPSQKQLFSLLFIDLVAIILLMYSSGGILNGLGYLLLVAVAAGGMLLRGQIAIFFAALASIAVISESTYRYFTSSLDNKAFFSAGSLGALIFIIAIAFQYLTRKIRSSNEEAIAQAQHVAHLQKLAQMIVERMRTGIVVFNKNRGIELLNNSARNLLGLPPEQTSRLTLRDVPALDHKVTQWQQAKKQYSPILKIDNGLSDEVKINFAPLESDENTDTLIFVEDNRAIAQQAQQLKLASLGRLTASIAHEIRNPLGAISHASQLLGESEGLSPHDQRLLEIIDNHCKRVNQIIENVLQLSRRRMAQPQQVQLNTWIEHFMEEYKNSRAEPVDIKVICLEHNIVGQFDPGQLHQVITNLCDNGLRYSKIAGGKASVILEIGVDEKLQRPYINVIDSGLGIALENLKHLFEPFFTTENTGSGLGLFICKELCEANQAFIHYRRTEDGSSCFHIQLAHHERAL